MHTNMYLQTLRQLCDWLLEEESHEHEVNFWDVGVFGQQSLQYRKSWEMTGISVDFT